MKGSIDAGALNVEIYIDFVLKCIHNDVILGGSIMLTLTKDMEIGVAKIDSQHRELIDRLNAVISMGVKAATKE